MTQTARPAARRVRTARGAVALAGAAALVGLSGAPAAEGSYTRCWRKPRQL